EDLAVELGMRLPSLRGNHPPIAHSLLVHKGRATLLDFPPDVLIAGHALPARESRGSQNLDAVTNPESPLLLAIEFAHDLEHLGIVAQILRRAAACRERRRSSHDHCIVGIISCCTVSCHRAGDLCRCRWSTEDNRSYTLHIHSCGTIRRESLSSDLDWCVQKWGYSQRHDH